MGMLLKLLVLGGVFFMLWQVLRRILRQGKHIVNDEQVTIALQPCAYCGTYVDEKTPYRKKDRLYCCRAHMELDS